jgi:hypothetical protein
MFKERARDKPILQQLSEGKCCLVRWRALQSSILKRVLGADLAIVFASENDICRDIEKIGKRKKSANETDGSAEFSTVSLLLV